MTGDEMTRIREALGLSRVQFGNAIGYTTANRNTVDVVIKRYESGERAIPPWIATTVRALDREGLMLFVRSYRSADDQAEFARQLSLHLIEGRPAQ